MTENLRANLQKATQPYLDKGYQIISFTETSAKLFKPKAKMGWWVAGLNTGAYARNKDRTATFQVTETGEITVTGDMLEQLEKDERTNKGVNIVRYVLLGIIVCILLTCIFMFFGGGW